MSFDANNQVTPEYVKVLSIHEFRSLWMAQVFSQIAGNTLLFALALRIYQTTSSNTAVSGLFLSFGIPAVIFGLIAGTAVDHLDKRRVLMLCDIARGILAFALIFLSHSVPTVYIIMFINALIGQFYVPSEAPLIPKLVPSALLVPANSLFSFTYYSSLALGSIFAGPLLRWFGPQGIFVFITVLFFIASFFVSRVSSQAVGVYGFWHVLHHDVFRLLKRIINELIDGVRYVSQSKVLFDSILLLTGTQILIALLGTLGPGFADRILGIDVRDASLLIVGPAVLGIILGALWVGNVGYNIQPVKLIRIGITSAGIILVAIALSVRANRMDMFQWLFRASIIVPLEFFLFFLLGVANSLLDVPANSMIQREAKGAMRGRVYGMLAAFVGGVGVLPVIVGGILADTIGIGKVIFLLGVVILTYGVYRVRYNR
jgi:MFS family permease